MKVKVISLQYIFQVLYILCFSRPRYQVSVYRTIGPLVFIHIRFNFELKFATKILSPNQFRINSKHIHVSDQSKLC